MANDDAGRWRRTAMAGAAVASVAVLGSLVVLGGPVAAEGGPACEAPAWQEPPDDEPWDDEPWGDEQQIRTEQGWQECDDPEPPPPPPPPPPPSDPEPEPPVVEVDRPGVAKISAVASCVSGTGTIEIALANVDGDLPIEFTVTHPTTKVTTAVTVPVGSSKPVTLLGTPTGAVQVTITADGTDRSRTFDVICPVPEVASEPPAPEGTIEPQVLPAGVAAPAGDVLPATGQDSTVLLLALALGLVAGGVAVVRTSRRTATSAVEPPDA